MAPTPALTPKAKKVMKFLEVIPGYVIGIGRTENHVLHDSSAIGG
jgi:hypothetical protein